MKRDRRRRDGRAWAVLLLCLSGCPEAPQKPAEKKTCQSDADCPARWICLGGACANPSGGAVYTDPGNAVTPRKVKQQVEAIDVKEEQARERALRNLNEP